MPTPTYIPLGTITLVSNTTTVTFSSIPATYRDLVLIWNGTITTSEDNVTLNVNGTGTNGSRVFMFGDGSGTSSGTSSTLTLGFPGTTVSSSVLQIFDYAQTDKHKTMLFRSNNTNSGVSAQAQRWASTSAITSLAISVGGGKQMVSGTTISLFGVN